MTLACAVALAKLKPSNVTHAKLIIEPVPGPKNPS